MKNGWMECCQRPLGPAELHLKPESAQGHLRWVHLLCFPPRYELTNNSCFALMLSVNVHKTQLTGLTCVGPYSTASVKSFHMLNK